MENNANKSTHIEQKTMFIIDAKVGACQVGFFAQKKTETTINSPIEGLKDDVATKPANPGICDK
jgi:hypothetical protein